MCRLCKDDSKEFKAFFSNLNHILVTEAKFLIFAYCKGKPFYFFKVVSLEDFPYKYVSCKCCLCKEIVWRSTLKLASPWLMSHLVSSQSCRLCIHPNGMEKHTVSTSIHSLEHLLSISSLSYCCENESQMLLLAPHCFKLHQLKLCS